MSAWKKAAKILIGRYCSPRRWYDGDTLNVCWCVKMSGAKISFEEVWQRMCKDFYINEAEAITRIPSKEDVREWYRERSELEQNIVFNMQGGFLEGDTMQTATPERLKKYGFDHLNNFQFKIGYGFFGRSGGWLAIRAFEGYNFLLDGLDEAMPNRVWRGLCCMIEEITEAVANRDDELQYLMADFMRHNTPELIPE